jgi:formate dehydrogenase iron-sulfur subunit
MAKKNAIMMLIDTSKCIGCKACQVACKQWHSLPAEDTTFTGSYSNPPDVSGKTLTAVKFTEFEDVRQKLYFVFFKKQCMHCNQAECQIFCPKGVEKTREGFVIFNDKCKPENVRLPGATLEEKKQAFLDCCPYFIPKYDEDNDRFVKCDFCANRFPSGYCGPSCSITYRSGKPIPTSTGPTTACEFTCPPGAITTGPAKQIMTFAKERLYEVKVNQNHPKAMLWGGRGRVVFLLTEHYANYGLPRAD